MLPVNPRPIAAVPGGRRLIVAEHQIGVRPLPGWRFDADGTLLTRWSMLPAERARLAGGNDVWMITHHGDDPVQPVRLATSAQELVAAWPVETAPDEVMLYTSCPVRREALRDPGVREQVANIMREQALRAMEEAARG